ncbi:cytochrome c [Paraburkholderia metrosideri]|uniref:Fructose dehydrogenase cytochrome subunit n=1 Tax=Paraburkholderia metrosideri TaxID=580937 RepID=A0ABN7HFQ7_9BURK|nr:cytochrome c [Paraburkholderia metrosideri]CAD6511915.1 Fructose dehydrogenase cytochrome subunit [Paraburkholderia metrosideri]
MTNTQPRRAFKGFPNALSSALLKWLPAAALTTLASFAFTGVAHADDTAQIKHGEYLARAADCIACHTSNKAQPFAGGVPFNLPFGTIYSTNITPDPVHGIGQLSDADFISAVREGKSKDGKRLYPAMPYTSYTQLTDADILAIRAYLRTVAPVAKPAPENTLSFPFNQRWAMMFWNLFNFSSGRFQEDPTKSAEWNRGAYLVGALAHCQECHTPRNFMQGLSSKALAGAELGNWTAFNITPDKNAGIGGWTEPELIAYLRDGAAPGKANAAGPMAEVVENSTRFLTPEDLKAMAVYLGTVPARNNGETQPRFSFGSPIQSVSQLRNQALTVLGGGAPADGRTLYNGNCASCHGWQGTGVGGDSAGAYPSLLHNTALGAATPNNLTMVVLHGVSRQTNQVHVAMPGFADQLSDADVATLVNFLSMQFGNPAATTSAANVAKMR